MTTSSSPFAADVDAFLTAEREFSEVHGEEARRRWSALGADAELPLEQQQATVIDRIGDSPQIWDALEWEVTCRITLLTNARRHARAARDGR